jgi:hypothetical protein
LIDGGGCGFGRHDFDVHRLAENSARVAAKWPGRIPRRVWDSSVNIALKLAEPDENRAELVDSYPVVGYDV